MRTNRPPTLCSLAPEDVIVQVAEWNQVRGRATAVEPVPGGARLRFGLDDAALIGGLVKREAACCAFLDFTTTQRADEVVVVVTTEDPAAHGVIALLSGIEVS